MSNSSVETVTTPSDKYKIVLAVVIIAVGIFAYSYFSDMNIYARVGMFVGSLVVAALIFWFSESGRRSVDFATGAYSELKRVVWPTRAETIQMTGIVFAFVIVMAIFLWLVDKLIEWIIYGVFLGWN
ncbi:MAG: preprotein translocase subunit SecE [Advenella sp.]|jgi:preprotein translocase subunit SecE|uniref:Protein translocase subunit SecE n=1 Tax=Advenella incenata TaxID=267800 RepID=A0A4Q7VF71_9BURK|nr:preprotein translocase subunit SecE [Advenella incenata]RZT93948.1 preprotein translocase subunit SecE [Advenella incenata]HLU02936.1 preprotein translocase subunit SecE [Advenella sp.]